ncbi:endogenous retrovirus group K member 8 Gag polyprotein-like [Cimex lectularius]|uniref:Uncharacterized protein n=1 Tax=Cimex lectularius TaxID=79782 RepID=A0A8I6S0Y7_CIMLE|nr:endogenous retrovirus group K member 8 Gag polyprotein-like [Cimex lectularius]
MPTKEDTKAKKASGKSSHHCICHKDAKKEKKSQKSKQINHSSQQGASKGMKQRSPFCAGFHYNTRKFSYSLSSSSSESESSEEESSSDEDEQPAMQYVPQMLMDPNIYSYYGQGPPMVGPLMVGPMAGSDMGPAVGPLMGGQPMACPSMGYSMGPSMGYYPPAQIYYQPPPMNWPPVPMMQQDLRPCPFGPQVELTVGGPPGYAGNPYASSVKNVDSRYAFNVEPIQEARKAQ